MNGGWRIAAPVGCALFIGLAAGDVAASPAPVAPYAKFTDGLICKTKPEGWLRKVCEKPRTPYACHYLVEALQDAGLDKEADRLLRSYWGGMVARGADTFWEVFNPEDDFASPYGSILYNSACHAWSCGPAYLLRRGCH